MNISMAMWNMRLLTACGARQTLPGLNIPPETLTMLHCLTLAMPMRVPSPLGLFFFGPNDLHMGPPSDMFRGHF